MVERKGCGCGEGKAVGALYVVAVPFAFLLTPLSVTSLTSWGVVFAGLTCATLAGKLYGMARNRNRPPEPAAAPVAPAARGAPAAPRAEGVVPIELQHIALDVPSAGFAFVTLPRAGPGTHRRLAR